MLGRRHHGLAGRTLRVWGPKARLTGYFDRSRKICTAYCPSLFEGIRPAWKATAGGTHLLRTSALTREARHGRLVPTSAPAKERQLTTLAANGDCKKNLDEGTVPLYGAGGEGPEPPQAVAKKPRKKVTTMTIRGKHRRREALSMITAYDYPSARSADQAGVDILLVGDSVGMVVLGYDSTTPVTMDEMLHHCKAVSRGAETSFLVGDLPFGSYLTPTDAMNNAVTLVKDGKMDAVKLEGGRRVADMAAAVADAGINIMGHIGLTPQTAAALGGYRIQGKSAEAAEELLADARALQDAGCFGIVLECVPDRIADYVTSCLSIPTVGIGAGPSCSGQVQVLHDVLGLYDKLQPKFSRQYLDGSGTIQAALEEYVADVGSASFPNKEESFLIADEQFDEFIATQIAVERADNHARKRESEREELLKQHAAASSSQKMAEAELAALSRQVAELQSRLLMQDGLAAVNERGSMEAEGMIRPQPGGGTRVKEAKAEAGHGHGFGQRYAAAPEWRLQQMD